MGSFVTGKSERLYSIQPHFFEENEWVHHGTEVPTESMYDPEPSSELTLLAKAHSALPM